MYIFIMGILNVHYVHCCKTFVPATLTCALELASFLAYGQERGRMAVDNKYI